MEKKCKWGFLRETKEEANHSGYDPDTGLKRTGLDDYLAVERDGEFDHPYRRI